MSNIDLFHFEHLKLAVQVQYLKNHTPSHEDISKWKGIDIIYFQEDLRQIAKGNISEKTFYTYFKTVPVTKLPRIDMLNLLSIYAGYASWHDFRKNGGLPEFETEHNVSEEVFAEIVSPAANPVSGEADKKLPGTAAETDITDDPVVLQSNDTEDQSLNEKRPSFQTYDTEQKPGRKSLKRYFLGAATVLLAMLAGYLGLGDRIFDTTYSYCFSDADRNASIQNMLEIKVIKENESPIMYRIQPGECFNYSTKDKVLRMEITSPFYENLNVNRNLEAAPREENIELKPDDYKMAVYYFSKKDISGNPDEALSLIKQKRNELESRISDNAVIYQVYDSDLYGIETLDKQKYITLVTTPTTSLRNLSVIEMKREKGKIVSIKFKINEDEENN